MSSTYDYYGWDLLYKSVCSTLENESEIILVLAHWFLTKNALFRCIGVGQDKTLGPDDVGSELLPEGWNASNNKYALRYRYGDDVYILLGVKTGNNFVLNLLDSKSRNVSNLSICPTNVVKESMGPLPVMIPTVNLILDRMKRELLDPVFSGSKKEMETQTEAARARSRSPPVPTILPEARFPPDPLAIPRSMSDNTTRRDPLRDVGRGDLDPLGRGGGGMIFTPPGMPFGPPGGGFNPALRRPPGARFDPFGPPDPDRPFGRNPNPNPDVFRPPPDYDDMYM
ncbi:proteasome inhibitor PI31 subunit isoform X2 [Hermetia illucens]|uniref:proteasome inhibitor PI31 subunit isoform X2 n=1 Tax=Hermetia illucens TaxID=343691 RepID=UPI0018CC44DA|nr:proteasome inhibitor PI31 subunit isoform X2 [Hermetia illucens]XP_037903637.1 proteasome inhibitor PI31 subunit isoform X2 [Hermetia illucens]